MVLEGWFIVIIKQARRCLRRGGHVALKRAGCQPILPFRLAFPSRSQGGYSLLSVRQETDVLQMRLYGMCVYKLQINDAFRMPLLTFDM